jgi:hypothetical protein
MQTTDCKFSENLTRNRGGFVRRSLDINAARTWALAAVALAAMWIVAVIYLPF